MADIHQDLSQHIKPLDYFVFASVLAASLGIGSFYGFCGKNKTNEEFLMAGRSMSTFPVTMSLLCSFISAITLLGNPVEVYFYGAHYTIMIFAFIPMTFAVVYIYMPVYFDLKVTSAYEYFEWRFSRKVRVIVAIFAMTHLIIYMPTTIFAPALALDQLTGINYQLSSAVIFIICILYTSLGGLKGVLWTDVLQAVVMFLALGMVIVLGIYEIGGFGIIWESTTEANRMKWIYLDPDLRARHTLWTAVIGGFLCWLPLFTATQSQIQRYNSVPTLRQARNSLWFNMVGMMILMVLCSLIGIMLVTYFHECDPTEAKQIHSPDQLVPYFVLQALGKYSGVPGLLIAGLICGSLSTVSSALNSLTAILTEDFVKLYRPGLSETRLALISKCISATAGCLTFALLFVIAIINETVQVGPFATLFQGALLGPVMGGVSIGMLYPWANDMGTFLGMVAGGIFTGFIGIGSIFASRAGTLPNQKLNLTTEGCDFGNSSQVGTIISHEFWKEEHADDSIAVKMFSLSYMWQPGCGHISTVLFGIIFSLIISLLQKNKSQPKVNIKLMSKPIVKLWIFLLGRERMERVIDFVEFDFGGKAAAAEMKLSSNNNSTLEKVAVLQVK